MWSKCSRPLLWFITLVKNGLGICIISTSQGLMTGKAAKEKKCGGEIICYIS